MARAFEGIRVLDFSQVLAAPFACQQLAQHGAEVIKIEQPGVGDQTRGLGADSRNPALTPSFMTCNVGKRSITVNLKSPRAMEIIEPLVRSADVLVENSRPGVMERLGFGYEAMRALRPDLIYCSVTGFGQSGPKSTMAAYDGAIQAASGMMAITGHPETGPVRTGYMPVDLGTALNAAFAIATALYRRQATGEGQHLDVAMMDSAMVLQAPQMSAWLARGNQPALLGNMSPTLQPTANVFSTSDGYIQVVALKDGQVRALFEAIARPDLSRDERFGTARDRLAYREDLLAELEPVFRADTTDSWYQRLIDAGIPVAEIRNFAQVAEDPQFDGRPVFTEVPDGAGGRTRVVGVGHTSNVDAPGTNVPPPGLGEHTAEILGELGMQPEQIEGLRADGTI